MVAHTVRSYPTPSPAPFNEDVIELSHFTTFSLRPPTITCFNERFMARILFRLLKIDHGSSGQGTGAFHTSH